MYIKKIIINNFKCYDKFVMEFDSDVTIVVGNNGEGRCYSFSLNGNV